MLIKRFPQFSKALQGEELVLVYMGKILKSNLEKSMFGTDELQASICEHGIKHMEEVDLAVL